MTSYSQGRNVEYYVIDYLQENGYDTIRAASSKGLADVVGIKDGQVVIVNCKRTRPPGPDERAELVRIACSGALVPLVALKPFRQPLEFRRLTGPGPRDWVRWTADELA